MVDKNTPLFSIALLVPSPDFCEKEKMMRKVFLKVFGS